MCVGKNLSYWTLYQLIVGQLNKDSKLVLLRALSPLSVLPYESPPLPTPPYHFHNGRDIDQWVRRVKRAGGERAGVRVGAETTVSLTHFPPNSFFLSHSSPSSFVSLYLPVSACPASSPKLPRFATSSYIFANLKGGVKLSGCTYRYPMMLSNYSDMLRASLEIW